MKKIHKIMLSVAPATAPLIILTSCNIVDFDAAKQYFDETWPIMREAFAKSSNYTESVLKGLNQIAKIEDCFISNKVNNYWSKTIINLRKESYSSTYWNLLYGNSGSERSKYYEPLKQELIDNGEWISGNITDKWGNNIDFIHMIATYNAWISHSGDSSLKDLAGWGGDLAQAAKDLKDGQESMPHFSNEDLYADVDACNIANIYLNWSDKTKTSSLPLFQYYTKLSGDVERFSSFYNDVLDLNKTSSMETKVAKLITRLKKSNYMGLYLQSISMSLTDDLTYFQQAAESFITKLESKLV